MSTTLTPAEELRAAALKIRESAEPAVTFNGFDVSVSVADWLDNTADWMADEHAHTQDRPEWTGLAEDMRWGVFDWHSDRDDNAVWKSALIAARTINNAQPEAPDTPKCEAPQTQDCPYPPTHIADYYSGKVLMVGDEPSPLMRRIPVCGACINDVPGLHRVRLNGGAR